MTSAYRSNIEYARTLQEKYEYYIAGLTFTLLALSIQTAKLGTEKAQIIFELFGWCLLLVSGIIALLRFRMQPVAHKNYALLDREKLRVKEYKLAQSNGTTEALLQETNQTVPLEKLIQDIEDSIKRNEPKLVAIEDTLINQHRWHLWLFVIGFVSVMLSRAYIPLKTLLC
jgi:hypothetical protein